MPSKCPFCNSELINSRVHCPNNKIYPCQECKKCHSYFYTKNNYIKLKNLASKNNQKLNSSVYYFSESIFEPQNTAKNMDKNQNLKHIQHKLEIDKLVVGAIVLSDNRKCIYKNHEMKDVIAKINIATKNDKIELISLPAAYCYTCSTYFVLKEDYKKAKLQGILLCSVDDRTSKYIQKHKNSTYTIGESQIHKMGYNVRKNNGYSDVQRRIVLANIMENTNITKHEILSIIDSGIARHKGQKSYQNAVSLWKNDREFVTNYKKGDMPEVLIENILLKFNIQNQ